MRVQLGNSQTMVDLQAGDLISIMYTDKCRQCSQYLLTHTENVQLHFQRGKFVNFRQSPSHPEKVDRGD